MQTEGSGIIEPTVDRLVAVGRALSDPIRVRMLSLLAEGRDGCELPCCPLPAPVDTAEGFCVCELVAYYGLGQSKVSYHLRVLKEAGLVTETVRGKWSFYKLNLKIVRQALGLLSRLVIQTEAVEVEP